VPTLDPQPHHQSSNASTPNTKPQTLNPRSTAPSPKLECYVMALNERNGGRTHYLAVNTEHVRNQWIECLRENAKYAQTRPTPLMSCLVAGDWLNLRIFFSYLDSVYPLVSGDCPKSYSSIASILLMDCLNSINGLPRFDPAVSARYMRGIAKSPCVLLKYCPMHASAPHAHRAHTSRF
jgi:hypothetical protein